MKTVRGLIGILLIVLVFVFIFNMKELEYSVFRWEMARNSDLFWYDNFMFSALIGIFIFIKGCHLLWTSSFQEFLIIWIAGSGCENYKNNHSNLQRVKEYRDSKMTFITNEAAANEYRQTAWLDGMDSYSGRNVERAKDYLNSKLQFKDNESALNYIKGKK